VVISNVNALIENEYYIEYRKSQYKKGECDMEDVKYISQIGDYTGDTQLHFEKNETLCDTMLNPLACFSVQNGKWIRQEVPGNIRRLHIGSNPYKSEFQVNHPEADEIHCIIQKAGTSWFIMESGKEDIMMVNGFPKRQIQLRQNQSGVVHLGNKNFVFSTQKIVPRIPENEVYANSSDLGETQYCVSYGEKSKIFNLDKLCLIGADPLCDFYLPGEPFYAMIAHYGKRLFLRSLVEDDHIPVEVGVESAYDNSVTLKPGSCINIGGVELKFKVSKDLRFTQNFNFVPDPKSGNLRLLEIDYQGNPGHSFVLPSTGHSITIGRDSEQCSLSIAVSPKISRVHAQAIVYDKALMLIDNSATNGTFVNNTRVKRRMVHPGDILRLGNANFILCFAG